MNQQRVTRGIILSRVDYGEADRILTILTPDAGKLRLMAKGVRRVKSKLAGGIELFSISHITFVKGRGEIGTLISTRLIKHYRNIVSDINRTMLGYELTKQLDKVTEDEPEADYFELLKNCFAALGDSAINVDLIRVWFGAQLLKLAGHAPNLQTDTNGVKLQAAANYDFSFDHMAFEQQDGGQFTADEIKFLRLLFSANPPNLLAKVQGNSELVGRVGRLVQTMLSQHLRLPA